MATPANVRKRAAEDMALIDVGGTPGSEDAARIDVALGWVHADLKDQGVAPWDGTADEGSDVIPDAIEPYVIQLVCFHLRNTYPLSPERFARNVAAAGPEGETAKRHIRRLTRQRWQQEDPTDF